MGQAGEDEIDDDRGLNFGWVGASKIPHRNHFVVWLSKSKSGGRGVS